MITPRKTGLCNVNSVLFSGMGMGKENQEVGRFTIDPESRATALHGKRQFWPRITLQFLRKSFRFAPWGNA